MGHHANLILIRIGPILHEADVELCRFSQKHLTLWKDNIKTSLQYIG
jgi:hypothetical protein